MKILFLSLSNAVKNLENRGIFPELINYFKKKGHEMFIVCPLERRFKKRTFLNVEGSVNILSVKTLNITKSNFIEKGIATILIEYQYNRAINKYFKSVKFDLILYVTPPISFNSLINKLKIKHNCKTYLMLKDIFPQNAIDLGLINKNGFFHRYFKRKETSLYSVSDRIGCMSEANIEYVLKNNAVVKNKLEVCPNAIQIRDRATKLLKDAVFEKYDIPKNLPIFLLGGNLGVAQGMDFLIEVLESNQNRKDLYFLIIGSGNRSHLIQKWIDKKSPLNLRFINQIERQEFDIIESFCDVGLVILDNRFTIPNFPSRVLSYMECEMPLLIATDEVSDIGPIAEENQFGIWSRSDDIHHFNENIDFYVNNKDERRIMGLNGRRFLEKHYTVAHAYQVIMEKVSVSTES